MMLFGKTENNEVTAEKSPNIFISRTKRSFFVIEIIGLSNEHAFWIRRGPGYSPR
jgi:hypothetical protein